MLGKRWLELAHLARICEAMEYLEELQYSITATLLELSLDSTTAVVGAA